MGTLWSRILSYLHQEPTPLSQAELDTAQAVLNMDPGNDYRGETEAVWDADVLEIWNDGDTFTARLRQKGSPDLLAEFSMKQCGITVEPGDLLIVTPEKVIKRNLGKWTQAELDNIDRRSREWFEALRRSIDGGSSDA